MDSLLNFVVYALIWTPSVLVYHKFVWKKVADSELKMFLTMLFGYFVASIGLDIAGHFVPLAGG